MSATELYKMPPPRAALDEARSGDIRGALGTIRHCDIAPRNGWWARLRTLLAILGPGLIVLSSWSATTTPGLSAPYPGRAGLWDRFAVDAGPAGAGARLDVMSQ
jgi:hypothetical protein